MKKSRLVMALLASTFMLFGCKAKGESSSSAAASSAPTSEVVPSSSSSSSEEEVVVHSLEEIESEIAEAVSDAAGASLSFRDSGYGYDYLGLNFGEDESYVDNAGEEICSSAVATLYQFMPDYLELVAAHFYDGTSEEEDYWGEGDGSTCYVVGLTNEDESVDVWIEGYCYNGRLLGYINASAAE